MAVTEIQILLFPKGNKLETFRKKRLLVRKTCNLGSIANSLLASCKGISPSPWYVSTTKTMPSPKMPLRGKPLKCPSRVWHHQSASASETPSTSIHPGKRRPGWTSRNKQGRRLGRYQVFLLLANTLLASLSMHRLLSGGRVLSNDELQLKAITTKDEWFWKNDCIPFYRRKQSIRSPPVTLQTKEFTGRTVHTPDTVHAMWLHREQTKDFPFLEKGL